MDFRQILYLFFILIVFNIITPTEGINIIVKTSKGRVKGVIMNSRGNSSSQMLAFKGIPYAEPPIEELRFKNQKLGESYYVPTNAVSTIDTEFKAINAALSYCLQVEEREIIEEEDAPVAHRQWRGTKILSDVDKPFCPQKNPNGTTDSWGYSENCLFVNVYTPLNATPESKLPVMVWIHGGGFVTGSGGFVTGMGPLCETRPDYLVDQNVIVVTLNYRLGALGFLSIGTDDAPGNAGLKDQSLALKWVHDEITLFGGDPNQTTIFGHSVGSASVHFHIISNMSTGLFQRAIGESGTTLSDWAFINTGYVERAKQLAVALNCTTIDGGVNMTCMQNANVLDILNRQSLALPDELTIPGNILSFVPSLEVNTTAPFLSDTPQNLIKDPPNKVPMIIGITEFEGNTFIPSNEEFYNILPEKMLYFIPNSIREKINNYTLNYKIEKINKFYFNDTTTSLGNLQGYVNLISDKMFGLATADTAKALTQFSKIYLYRFDYDGNFRFPLPTRSVLNLKGASHGDELGYIFSMRGINTEGFAVVSPEMKLLRKMVKLWTNFAKFGTPTPETVDADLENTQWTPISVNTTNYLIINENLTMTVENFLKRSVDFWEDIKSTDNVTPTPSPITPPLPTTIPPTTDTSAPTTVTSPTNATSPTTDTSAPTTVTSPTNATSTTTDTSAPTTVTSPTTVTTAPTTVTSPTNVTTPTTDTTAPTTVTSPTNDTSPTTDTSAPTTVTSPTTDTSAPTTVTSPTTDTPAPTTVTSPTNATSAPTTVTSPTTVTTAPTTVTSPTNDTSPTTDTTAPTTVTSPTNDTSPTTTDTSAPTTVTSPTNATSAPTTVTSPTNATSPTTDKSAPTTVTSPPITPAPTIPPTPSPSSSTYIKFNIFNFIYTVFIMFQLL